ncbi:MAG: hypothetical protein OXB93_04120 [Cytophagales bacterium]|nr:hypothetical protein [Cytophagales bacterium]
MREAKMHVIPCMTYLSLCLLLLGIPRVGLPQGDPPIGRSGTEQKAYVQGGSRRGGALELRKAARDFAVSLYEKKNLEEAYTYLSRKTATLSPFSKFSAFYQKNMLFQQGDFDLKRLRDVSADPFIPQRRVEIFYTSKTLPGQEFQITFTLEKNEKQEWKIVWIQHVELRIKELFIKSEFDDVINIGQKALSYDPINLDIIKCLAFCYLRKEDVEMAAIYSEKALTHGPKDPGAHNLQAILYVGLEEPEQSQIHHKKAIRWSADSLEKSISHANRALQLLEEENYPAAEKMVQKAIRLAPQDAHSWYVRGITQQIMGDFEKAIQSFEKAINLPFMNDNLLQANLFYEYAYLLYHHYVENDQIFRKGVNGKTYNIYDICRVYTEKAIQLYPRDEDYHDLATLLGLNTEELLNSNSTSSSRNM